jgi:quercetin dioxygenase-like cupin family protein
METSETAAVFLPVSGNREGGGRLIQLKQNGSWIMRDSTIKKVSEKTAPKGTMGQTYLVSGKRVALRIWEKEPPQEKQSDSRDYETVGYVIAGRAELTLEGQTIKLEPGDSWLVPAQAQHSYRILEPFTAVEATAPPAQVHGRDEARS